MPAGRTRSRTRSRRSRRPSLRTACRSRFDLGLTQPGEAALLPTRKLAPSPSVGTGSLPASRRSRPSKGHGVHGGSGLRPAAPPAGAGRSSPSALAAYLAQASVGACRAGGRWVGRVRQSARGRCPHAGEPPAPGLPSHAPPARASSPTSPAWSSIPRRAASASSRPFARHSRSPSVPVLVDPLEPALARRHLLVCLAQPNLAQPNVGVRLEGCVGCGLVLAPAAAPLRKRPLQPPYRVVVWRDR
jgi:hypothetical protein